MTPQSQIPLVSTIGERCRVCYQCVRECPAKAIRIADHRAQVLPERCIGCGVCFKVCTQGAKKVLSAVEAVETLLAGSAPVAAILAPSFPAEFIGYEYGQVVGTLRRLGFASVHEVAFGAELVAIAVPETGGAGRRAAVDCHDVPGGGRVRQALRPRPDPLARPDRLADDRDRPGCSGRRTARACTSSSSARASRRNGRPCPPTWPGEVDEALTFAEMRQLVAARHLDIGGADSHRFRRAARARRRALPDQRRHAADGGHPGGPRDRTRDGRRGAGGIRPGHQGSRKRASWRPGCSSCSSARAVRWGRA